MNITNSQLLLKLRFASLNCGGLKQFLHEVFNLCNKHDIICIQEHWLLPHELNQLSCVHANFVGCCLTAVNVEHNVLKGRLMVALAFSTKKLAKAVKIIHSDND